MVNRGTGKEREETRDNSMCATLKIPAPYPHQARRQERGGVVVAVLMNQSLASSVAGGGD